MKVTVKDCLELNIFKDAKVLAGEAGLAGEVRMLTTIDACDIKDIQFADTNKATIVLTSFLSVRDDADGQSYFVRAIANRGCAGIAVFNVGRAVSEIDEKVIKTAEEEGLPLIQMSADASVTKATTEIMDRILYGDNFRNRLISNTVFHLLNFEKHSNFQSAVREAAINNDFQLFILSEDFNPIFSVETRHRATIEDAIRLGRERNVEGESSKVYTMIDVNGVLTYWGPVSIDNEKYYMTIVDNEDSYTAGEITKLAEIIELAMGMWKYTPERDVRAEFLKALIRGNRSLAYTLQDEAKINGDDIICAFFTKMDDKETESQILTDFERKTDLDVMKIVEGDETYGMILATDEDIPKNSYQNDCKALFNRLKENREARMLHVTGVNGIEGAGDAFKLISESWNFVQNVFPYKRVFTKYELTLVSNCINIQLQGGFVKKSYSELLDPFKDLGENKSRQLQDTLETFVLDAGMNINNTAEFMNVHANTIQYRLKKINEILGVEITANRIIPGLTMALALKRLEKSAQ